jgi:hypothetical protein
MNGPLLATHEQPVSVTVKDFLVQAWVDHSGEPAAAPVWTIQLGENRYAGPPVDAAGHASLHDVKEMLRQWAKEHPALFV